MAFAASKTLTAWPALPVTLLLFTFIMPPETSVSMGSLRLSPYRVTLIIYLLPALNIMLQNRSNPLGAPDGLMLMHSFWAALALILTAGLAESTDTAGIYFIETFGAYSIARAYVQTPSDFAKVIKLIFTIAASLLVFAAIESFTGAHILRDPFQAVFGGIGPHFVEPRLGLARAFASFEHPILYGVFVASAFSGTYYVLCDAQLNYGSARKLLIVILATFFSLSGGPFTALGFQMALIGWDNITKGITGRWKILAGIFVSIWLVISLLSNRSPVLIFISYLTFSAESAYNRVHVWNYGTAEVMRHPYIGLGLGDWIRAPWMSSSMDNFWLLTTMRYGIPALVFFLLAIWFIAIRIRNITTLTGAARNAAKTWLITIMSFGLAGLTVHFWNAVMVLFFFFVGCGMAMTHKPAKKHRSPAIPMKLSRRNLAWT